VREFVEEEILSEIISEEDGANTSAGTNDEGYQQTPAERFRALRPTLESLGIAKSLYSTAASTTATTATETGTVEDDDTLLTSDIDDDEINSYLLNSDEVKMKEEMWMANYEDYMKAVEEKQRVKEEERLKEEQDGTAKKKKAPARKRKPAQQMEPSATANEAIEKIVQEKKLSNKINYEVLKSLTVDSSKDVDKDSSSLTDSAASSSKAGSESTPMSRFKPYPVKKPLSEAPATGTERRFRIGARLASTFSSSQRNPKAEARAQDSSATSADT